MTNGNYPARLAILYALFWLWMAWEPHNRSDWLLENVLVALAVAALVYGQRVLPFSRPSNTLIFIFLCMHTLGSHYTYSLVPYNDWTAALFGSPLNDWFGMERNHYDRLVHFSYGLLLVYPARELFLRIVGGSGFWSGFVALNVVMSTSMVYELIEWGAAELFGGELGAAFLGSQGDIWDAQKDMALASLGALITLGISAVSRRLRPLG